MMLRALLGLLAFAAAVPAAAVDDLRKVEIWIEVNNPLFPCMCYHPDERWLKAHGVNPEKTGHVELANAANFLTWTRHQPWMVLHELAHAYHDQVLGFESAAVKDRYEAAKREGLYKSVLHIDGEEREHYALKNHHEFFAEMTEAYVRTNDFYPFVRSELKRHDPETYRLLEGIWGKVGE